LKKDYGVDAAAIVSAGLALTGLDVHDNKKKP